MTGGASQNSSHTRHRAVMEKSKASTPESESRLQDLGAQSSSLLLYKVILLRRATLSGFSDDVTFKINSVIHKKWEPNLFNI